MLFKGMYFYISENKLYCSGVGVVKYDDKLIGIFGNEHIDSCVKELSPSSEDIGVLDTRDIKHGLSVKISSYLSLSILALTLGVVTLLRKSKK
uniref:Uncharacterized protein n=1 Tax=viral metagenome TaxID=1070528 RepID=A0A6C0BET5_9ZZZZ